MSSRSLYLPHSQVFFIKKGDLNLSLITRALLDDSPMLLNGKKMSPNEKHQTTSEIFHCRGMHWFCGHTSKLGVRVAISVNSVEFDYVAIIVNSVELNHELDRAFINRAHTSRCDGSHGESSSAMAALAPAPSVGASLVSMDIRSLGRSL